MEVIIDLPLKSKNQTLTSCKEIRNKVYELCKEPKSMKLVHLFPDTAEFPWIKKREYAALTQVNRRIRYEFLPMYISDNEVCIIPEDVHAYAETFLQARAPHPTRVEVDCTGSSSPAFCDIAFLVNVVTHAPDVQILFTAFEGRRAFDSVAAKSINQILSIAQDPKYIEEWRVSMGMISEMNIVHYGSWTIIPNTHEPYFRITINKEYDDGAHGNLWVSRFLKRMGLDNSYIEVRVCL